MVCETIKSECVFMIKKGCVFNGGRYYLIGANLVITVDYPTGQYCRVYPDPNSMTIRKLAKSITHQEGNRRTYTKTQFA